MPQSTGSQIGRRDLAIEQQITYNRKESEKEYTYIYTHTYIHITELFCYIPEANIVN